MTLLFGSTAAEATVGIFVDLASQRMHVTSATGSYSWPISSARSGYRTPNGTFGVQSMQVMHRSRLYHNSPMPHSIFFAGGYAIHVTYSTGALGTPASHGCIRISPGNAAALYRMVQAEGARITITGAPRTSRTYAGVRRGTIGTAYAGSRVNRRFVAHRVKTIGGPVSATAARWSTPAYSTPRITSRTMRPTTRTGSTPI